jgi:two-component system sensor histidine kinase BaeS
VSPVHPSRPIRLGTRMAITIGTTVAVVFLVAGAIMSGVVNDRFDSYLAEARYGRYDQVASLTADLVRGQGSLELRKQDLRYLAVVAGGTIAVRDPVGNVIAQIDTLPGGASGPGQGASAPNAAPIVVPIVVDGAAVGSLAIRPFAGADDVSAPAPVAFHEDTTLMVVGAAVLAALLAFLATLVLARRLTRPLGTLAGAARRVERGDLSVRVPLPGDAESQDLAVAFNQMATRLEHSESLRRQAASDLAHELATPVTVLTGRLQAITDGLVPARPETLVAARDAAEEVRRLVADLQDLAEAEGASLRRTVARSDLRVIVERSAATAAGTFEAAGVDLSVEPPRVGATFAIDVDGRQVERAIGNLLTNSATYTPRGGSATMSLARDGAWTTLRVRDTGRGIAVDDLPHVFDRFFRGDRARGRLEGRPGGTGIGLTVARDLVAANGGRVDVEATSAGGTTIILALPSADGPHAP